MLPGIFPSAAILENFLCECNGAGDSGDPRFDVLADFGSGDVQDIFTDVGNTVAFLADGFDVHFQFFAFFDCRTLDFGLGFAFSDRAFGTACFAEKHLDSRIRQKRETPGFTVQNRGCIFIHLHVADGQKGNTSHFTSNLAHEAVHAAEAVLHYTNIHEDPSYVSECLAYLVGYIARKTVVFANELFTIRREEAKRLKQLAAEPNA